MVNVVLLGPPGAGKGTQAALLGRREGLAHLSTGDAFRAAIASGSELGREVQGIVESGRLVPDETVARVVGAALDGLTEGGGVLFDGFPRTAHQARLLDELLADRGLPPPIVLELEVPDEAVIARLGGRKTCATHGPRPATDGAGCAECGAELVVRADDRPDVIRERLAVYHEQTAPLSALYRERGSLWTVDGTGSPEQVGERLLATLADARGAVEGESP